MSERPTPKRLAEIRQTILEFYPGAIYEFDLLLTELDAVTRERDEARKIIAEWTTTDCGPCGSLNDVGGIRDA